MTGATVNLDDPALYRERDPSGMVDLLHAFPQHCLEGWEDAARLKLPSSYGQVERVLFLGMGGSAMAGDLLAGLTLQERSGRQIDIHRSYGIPSWVDERTLVIASSYSGNTAEILSGVQPALDQRAKLLAVTSGGRLAEVAREVGIPQVSIGLEAPPRAALGVTFTSLLRILQDMGLMAEMESQMREVKELLPEVERGLNEGTPTHNNLAKRLAYEMWGRITAVYGTGMLGAVARRWKTQINENAKTWASAEELPEVDHNGVVGYRYPKELRERFFVVLLGSPLVDERILRHLTITAEVLDKEGVPYWHVTPPGANPVGQMLAAILYGDYASYYLALLNGVDPTPVEAIDYLKRRLEES